MNIEKYLKKINLEKMLKELNIENIKDCDNNLMANCPFHIENNPSWGINKITGVYHCFTCGASGNLITLICKLKKISAKQSINYLYQKIGIKQDIIINVKNIKSKIKKLNQPIKKNQSLKIPVTSKAILYPETIRDFYYGFLYFEGRNINKETLVKYDISFCRKGFYKNRAIIPIYDENNNRISFEARDITGMAEKKVLYPKGVSIKQTLFNLNIAKQQNEVIIVEGIMDTLYLTQRGFNVVSIYGVELSEKQEMFLSKYFSKIYLALDCDKNKAGQKATKKIKKRLLKHSEIRIINLPIGKDPDEISSQQFQILKDKANENNDSTYSQLYNEIKRKTTT